MRRNNKFEYFFLASISFSVVLLVWWFVSAAGFVNVIFLPAPSAVAAASAGLFIKHDFLTDVAVSMARMFAGFGIAVICAVPAGIAVGLNKRVEALAEPLINFIRYTPIAAFIPLFILWFGIGESEKIIVIFASTFFQLVIMIANSVSLVPRELIESARTLGANTWDVVAKVVYPYSKPRILDDMRVSMGWAWSGLLIAEIVASSSGIGYFIIQSQRLLQTTNVIGAILAVGVIGLLIDMAFKRLYIYWFPWAERTHA